MIGSDIEIAQAATLKPIIQMARDRLGIPPEALEAAAKAICKDAVDIFRPCKTACFVCKSNARAACLAMLKAWPSMRNSQHVSFDGQTESAIILPLPQKEPTND